MTRRSRSSALFRAVPIAVSGGAYEIESLGAVVLKKDKAATGARFDQIDHELSLSAVHVQTDADMEVYYPLSYARNCKMTSLIP